jgi:thiol-disulfide isomerase/thioredoxin
VTRRQVLALLAVAVGSGVLGLGLSVAIYGPGPLQRTPLGRWVDRLDDGGMALGDPVPRIAVRDFSGSPVIVPASGQVTLVNYWASWCGPCREEMPLLSAFAAQQGANGVHVLGIALEDPGPAQAFLATGPVGYPVAHEPPSATDSSVTLGNARGLLPYSVLVGADGRLLARRLGPFRDAADLQAWLAGAGVASTAPPSR